MNTSGCSKQNRSTTGTLRAASPKAARWVALALTLNLVAGCNTQNQSSDEGDASGDSGAPNAPAPARILSAYYGLDALPLVANFLCFGIAGEDGMPVTFSVQLDIALVSPTAFAVETGTGDIVTPLCATLRPADGPLELRTVLLAGPFGTPDSQPRSVEVVGPLQDIDGNSLFGLRTENVTALEAGPSLVLAERFAPGTPGLEGKCPDATEQVVQLTWEGGVSGPQGTALAESQRLGVSIDLENGNRVQPIALGDDDPDNFVIACIADANPAISVRVAPGLFHDPGDDPNPETTVDVVPGPGGM